MSVAVNGSEDDQIHCTKAREVAEDSLAAIAEEIMTLLQEETDALAQEDTPTKDTEELETNVVIDDE